MTKTKTKTNSCYHQFAIEWLANNQPKETDNQRRGREAHEVLLKP
jgi:hypothetical protein